MSSTSQRHISQLISKQWGGGASENEGNTFSRQVLPRKLPSHKASWGLHTCRMVLHFFSMKYISNNTGLISFREGSSFWALYTLELTTSSLQMLDCSTYNIFEYIKREGPLVEQDPGEPSKVALIYFDMHSDVSSSLGTIPQVGHAHDTLAQFGISENPFRRDLEIIAKIPICPQYTVIPEVVTLQAELLRYFKHLNGCRALGSVI